MRIEKYAKNALVLRISLKLEKNVERAREVCSSSVSNIKSSPSNSKSSVSG